MQATIGYLRVSTREQGRSGLGLAAQRHEIEAFAIARRVRRQVLAPGCADRRGSGCVAAATGACDSPEGGKVGPVPADRLEARPPVAQRALHYRTHGASGALHRRSAREGSRRLHAAHMGIARGAGTEDDFGAHEGRLGGRKAQRAEVWAGVPVEGVAAASQCTWFMRR